MDAAKEQIIISVIVPNYNTAKFLPKTIKSIQTFCQNYQYEIIIVDDGSNKADRLILKRLNLANIKVIMQNHCGVSHARNVGIQAARGKYIMFCDADDELYSSLPKAVHKADIISYSAHCRKDRFVKTDKGKRKLIASMFGFNQKAADFPAVYGGSVSKLFYRSFLLEHEILFDEQLANSEDLLFNLQAIMAAKLIRVERRTVYLYKQRTSSVTHSFDKKLLENHIYFIKDVQKELQDNDFQLVAQIESLYLYQLIFRFFCFIPDYRQQYKKWCLAIKHTGTWSTELNRNVERLSIWLTNSLGIQAAVLFARLYLQAKRLTQRSSERSIAL